MRLALAAVLLTLLLAGCATSPPTPTPKVVGGTACDVPALTPDASWKGEAPRVKFTTSMGEILVELDMERAPLTASNFLNLTKSGYYDDQSFYRVAKNFVIQGGSRSGAPAKIPDEFNPSLRHSDAGILSMATAGPDTGSSEFFITLTATSSLDDRHAVFGKVVGGMDVVRAIGALPTTPPNDGQPTPKVSITKGVVVDVATFEATHAVGIHPVVTEKKAEAGRGVTFAVILQNQGTVRDAVGLKATLPAGWTCSVDQRPVVPAGTARVVFLTLIPPASASGSTDVPISAVSAWNGTGEAAASVKVTIAPLGAQVKEGDTITANYIGFLPDGRLFDTSVESVAKDDTMPKFATTGGWSGPRGSYAPFSFTVGPKCQTHQPADCVIEGFNALAKTAKEGETATMRIPAKDAYAQGNMYQRPLTGRDLIFELEIVKIG